MYICSFGKIQNVAETELSEEKIYCFTGEKFTFRFHIYFCASFAFYLLVSDT